MMLMINNNKLISLLNCIIYKDIGTIIKETIEAREEYFFIRATNNHENIKISPKILFIAKIYPIYVATPLPPLNFNHIGNI